MRYFNEFEIVPIYHINIFLCIIYQYIYIYRYILLFLNHKRHRSVIYYLTFFSAASVADPCTVPLPPSVEHQQHPETKENVVATVDFFERSLTQELGTLGRDIRGPASNRLGRGKQQLPDGSRWTTFIDQITLERKRTWDIALSVVSEYFTVLKGESIEHAKCRARCKMILNAVQVVNRCSTQLHLRVLIG